MDPILSLSLSLQHRVTLSLQHRVNMPLYMNSFFLKFSPFFVFVTLSSRELRLEEHSKFCQTIIVNENMTVLGDSLKHENYISQTRIAILRRELLSEKYTRNIVKSRQTRITTEKSNSRSHRQRMCISPVILLRELLTKETRFV